LAERGIMVSYETIRQWVTHFSPMIAADLRKRRPKPYTTWHLDEVYLKIDGRMVYLWRAVDAEGDVLDVLVQTRRIKRAALKLIRKLLKKYGFIPDKLVTDDLRSYAAAASDLGIAKRHERGATPPGSRHYQRSSTLSDYRMSIYVTQASVGTLSASRALIAVTRVLGGVEQQVTTRTWMDIEDEKPDDRKVGVL
jgi:transposase-like protein